MTLFLQSFLNLSQTIRYGIWHLPSMPKMVPNCCVFYIILCGHIFKNVPFYWGMKITSFTFQKFKNTSMWYRWTFNVDLVCTSMSLTFLPHEVWIWKWWFRRVLDLYNLRLGSSSHDYTIIQNISKKGTHVKTHKHE
jgi:hypothetical protein